MILPSFIVLATLFSAVNARTCYECYDRNDCQSPSTIICPSDSYGCATAVLDIEPYITKGCLSDDKGPFKLHGCKRKTKNGVTGQLCGCMGQDLCNVNCSRDDSSCDETAEMNASNHANSPPKNNGAATTPDFFSTEGPSTLSPLSSSAPSDPVNLAVTLDPFTLSTLIAGGESTTVEHEPSTTPGQNKESTTPDFEASTTRGPKHSRAPRVRPSTPGQNKGSKIPNFETSTAPGQTETTSNFETSTTSDFETSTTPDFETSTTPDFETSTVPNFEASTTPDSSGPTSALPDSSGPTSVLPDSSESTPIPSTNVPGLLASTSALPGSSGSTPIPSTNVPELLASTSALPGISESTPASPAPGVSRSTRSHPASPAPGGSTPASPAPGGSTPTSPAPDASTPSPMANAARVAAPQSSANSVPPSGATMTATTPAAKSSVEKNNEHWQLTIMLIGASWILFLTTLG